MCRLLVVEQTWAYLVTRAPQPWTTVDVGTYGERRGGEALECFTDYGDWGLEKDRMNGRRSGRVEWMARERESCNQKNSRDYTRRIKGSKRSRLQCVVGEKLVRKIKLKPYREERKTGHRCAGKRFICMQQSAITRRR